MSSENKSVRCKYFQATFKSWQGLFDEAAKFVESIGSDNLITISHSQDGMNGIVAVWYWE